MQVIRAGIVSRPLARISEATSWTGVLKPQAMNKKLIQVKLKIHSENTERLTLIENELIQIIGKLDNEELNEKFIDWLNQRARCNESYFAYLKTIMP